MQHKATMMKESLCEKRGKIGFGDRENIGMHRFQGD